MSINIEPALMFDPVLGLGHEVIGLTAESLIEHQGQFKIKTKRAMEFPLLVKVRWRVRLWVRYALGVWVTYQ